jgi:tetratricopeptide (TPR) repeat protein
MLLLSLLIAAAPDASGIVWIHDDWEKAKKAAIAKKQLVAVDVWATWCHTCLSMKNYALKEAPMAKVKDTHVWLALDFDKEANAAFFEKIPAGALPTFMVVDPKTDTVVARWLGSGTSSEMAAFFAEAGKPSEDSLKRGTMALTKGDLPKAREIFEGALKKEKLDRTAKTRILNGLLEVLYKVDEKACARQLAPYVEELEDTAQGLDVVAMIADCAVALEDKTERHAIMSTVAKRLEPAATKDSALLAVDDRSAYLGTLVMIYDELGDKAKADALAQKRIVLLEGAAKTAKTQEARSTFDYHRMETYLRLNRFDDAIAMLTASEQAQPKDFNHPWRLAIVYLKKGDHDRGLAAIDRAIRNGYGGRKMRLYSTKLDLLVAKKDLAAAKTVIAEGRNHMQKIKKSQLRDSWKNEFESKVKLVETPEQKS